MSEDTDSTSDTPLNGTGSIGVVKSLDSDQTAKRVLLADINMMVGIRRQLRDMMEYQPTLKLVDDIIHKMLQKLDGLYTYQSVAQVEEFSPATTPTVAQLRGGAKNCSIEEEKTNPT